MGRRFYKKEKNYQIWWVDNTETKGEHLFTFDKKRIFNLFQDYPHELTKEQRRIFEDENPYWARFFRKRSEKKE